MHVKFAACLAVAAAVITNAAPVRRPSAPASARGYSLHDRIAQMIVVRGYGDYPNPSDAELKRFEHWIRDVRVGGFIVAGRIRNGNVLSANPFELAAFVNHVQRIARTPLLVASDFERGASMRTSETASFPYMMAFGAAHDLDATKQLGRITAKEARAMGINWVFAPDADVNNNPDNPIINVRSFGEDPQAVAANVGAFIDGAHSDPSSYVLVSAKHFPGHGDTAEDSHMQLAKVTASRERMNTTELVPFRAAIEHKADSIMTAHLQAPAIEPAGLPSTLSPKVLTGLLRDELGFKGLVVTDALEMAGITSQFPEREACVRAVEAGADVLLMPLDPERCVDAIANAVKSGRLSSKRIDASFSRIMAAKSKVGLPRRRTVDLDAISEQAEAPQYYDLADTVATRAVTLVKDERGLVPTPKAGNACLVTMTDNAFSSRGELLYHDLRASAPNLRLFQVDGAMDPGLLASYVTAASTCDQIYIAAFVTVNANRGSVALEGALGGFMSQVIASGKPVALIALGNPYLLRDYPGVSTYLATFSSTQTSEIAVARVLQGKARVSGTLPISIPPVAKIGDGLTR